MHYTWNTTTVKSHDADRNKVNIYRSGRVGYTSYAEFSYALVM